MQQALMKALCVGLKVNTGTSCCIVIVSFNCCHTSLSRSVHLLEKMKFIVCACLFSHPTPCWAYNIFLFYSFHSFFYFIFSLLRQFPFFVHFTEQCAVISILWDYRIKISDLSIEFSQTVRPKIVANNFAYYIYSTCTYYTSIWQCWPNVVRFVKPYKRGILTTGTALWFQ